MSLTLRQVRYFVATAEKVRAMAARWPQAVLKLVEDKANGPAVIAYLRRTEELNYNENGTPVDNGIDARGGTLTTELTCCIKNPAAFGLIYNFTAGAAG